MMNKRLDVVDGLFHDDHMRALNDAYHSSLWTYHHGARHDSKDSTVFFHSNRYLFADNIVNLIDCPLQKLTFETIKDYYKFTVKPKPSDDKNIYLNGQTYELDGGQHIDSYVQDSSVNASFTIIYMVNTDDADIKGFWTPYNTIPFKTGRVVIFSSIMPHAGLSTTVKNKVRMTLTWKSFDLMLDKDSPLCYSESNK